MSPKAFRLVDALGASEKSQADARRSQNRAIQAEPEREPEKMHRAGTTLAAPRKKSDADVQDDPMEAVLTKAAELLGYGAISPRRLSQKLLQRGYDADTVAAAIGYLTERGLLRESEDAVRFAEQGVRKLWGTRRIREDLYARGFSSDAIDEAMEALESVDFEENCAKVIRKKYGSAPEDPAELKKMTAALVRCGYTFSEIKAAVRLIRDD